MNSFDQRKKNVLSKIDKSSKGSWDKHILKLCEKINRKKDFYTTSSCSGRLILIKNISREKRGVVLKSYHDSVNYFDFKKDVDGILKTNKDVVLKFEPSILHIACRDINSMKELYEVAKNSGWKNVGAISFSDNFILDIRSSERLEIPIIVDGTMIVDDNFLEICVKESNKKLKNCWEKIKNFEILL